LSGCCSASRWQGIGDQAGATGGFTFSATVQDRVIVRTNYSNTPATAGSPASRHDDLMVIYVEGDAVKADYFDNEGHVIRYLVQPRPGGVVFVSEIRPGEPRYRLTYTRADDATITGGFEVAPPGRPDEFAAYLSWRARKIR
jgi:phage-related tail fiber protein